MLDTASLRRLLLPPKITPPPWMPVRVNWKHPLTRGLILASLPVKTLANIAQASAPVSATGTATFVPRLPGVASYHGGAFSYVLPTPRIMGAETGFTVFSHATNNNVTGAGKNSIDADTGAVNRVFQLITATNPVLVTFTSGGGANLTYSGVTLTSAAAAGGMTISGKIDDAAKVPYITVNGSRTAGSSQVSVRPISNSAAITIGSHSGSFVQVWPDAIHLSLAWSRALLDSEEDLLHRDPYCVFELDDYSFFARTASMVTATLAITDPVEYLAGGAVVAVNGVLSESDPIEVVSAEAQANVSGSLSLPDLVESMSGEAGVRVDATLATSDLVETVNGASVVLVLSSLAAVDPVEAVGAAASTPVSGSLSVSDIVEALTSAGEVRVSASLSIEDILEALAGVGVAVDVVLTDYPRHVEFPADRRIVLFQTENRSVEFPPDRHHIIFPEDR